jgi:hypothetical protein
MLGNEGRMLRFERSGVVTRIITTMQPTKSQRCRVGEIHLARGEEGPEPDQSVRVECAFRLCLPWNRDYPETTIFVKVKHTFNLVGWDVVLLHASSYAGRVVSASAILIDYRVAERVRG